MRSQIENQLKASIAVKQAFLDNEENLITLQQLAELCVETFENGNKLLFAGNGGSASDAQHIAAELVGRFELNRNGLPALALTTNTSSLTAIANDFGYPSVYQRQIEAFANGGDVFFGLSTSGNSDNIVKAVEQCEKTGVITVGMTGDSGGQMKELCDYCVCVPSSNTARVQEVHITVGHILCQLIETKLFP